MPGCSSTTSSSPASITFADQEATVLTQLLASCVETGGAHRGPGRKGGGKQSNVSQNSSTRDAHAPRAHKSKRYMTSNVSSVGIPASSTSSSRLVSARSAGSLRPVGTEKRRKTKDLGTWDRVLVCNGVNVYTSSHKGCDPWRLGVPRTSTHLGTKHHLFVAGCPGWTTPHDL